MFILDEDQFCEFDPGNAREFVDCWCRHYHGEVKVFGSSENIDYLGELNLDGKLTEQNLKRLLRWKDPRWLTEEISSGPNRGEKNKRAENVIRELKSINDFRAKKIDKHEFDKKAIEIFPSGPVWQILLFHIARPWEYPLADQNVFRAFSAHKNKTVPLDWGGYKLYMDYFFTVAGAAGVKRPEGNESNIKDIVAELKKVDSALFAFGQFLSSYGQKKQPKDEMQTEK